MTSPSTRAPLVVAAKRLPVSRDHSNDTLWPLGHDTIAVPGLRPDLRIGLFLHIPFPSEELFLRIPWRDAPARGLLGADVVGFQTRASASNFRRIARRLFALRTREAEEFVAANFNRPAVLVLSEFADAAMSMKAALLVNPFDIRGVKRAMLTALDMAAPQRLGMMRRLSPAVRRNDAEWWSRTFLQQLEAS